MISSRTLGETMTGMRVPWAYTVLVAMGLGCLNAPVQAASSGGATTGVTTSGAASGSTTGSSSGSGTGTSSATPSNWKR